MLLLVNPTAVFTVRTSAVRLSHKHDLASHWISVGCVGEDKAVPSDLNDSPVSTDLLLKKEGLRDPTLTHSRFLFNLCRTRVRQILLSYSNGSPRR